MIPSFVLVDNDSNTVSVDSRAGVLKSAIQRANSSSDSSIIGRQFGFVIPNQASLMHEVSKFLPSFYLIFFFILLLMLMYL